VPRWKPLPEETAPSARQLVGQLRRLKDRSGLSMTGLAARTTCSRSSWERYLSGAALPSQRAIRDLCELTGADPVRLLALREVARTVRPAESDPRPSGRGIGRGAFVTVLALVFVTAAVLGAVLGLSPKQRALGAVTCHVHSVDGALYAGYSSTWRRTVALGYYDEYVAEAECLLRHRGYTTGPVDGLYDVATREAARRAQRDGGEVADGKIGPLTWPLLRREG